tara:strand:+ start:43 stop:954 length:912 start_codon:yes stop_codon:yes gene_type:complete
MANAILKELLKFLNKASDPADANIATGGMKSFSDEAQPYLDRVLNKTKLMDLPSDADLQGYQSYVFHHAGKKGLDSYNLDATPLNAINTPEGLYTGTNIKKGQRYLEELTRKGKDGEIYDLVTNAQKVFVQGADKPNKTMIDAYRKHLEERFGNDTPYIKNKLDAFIQSGWIPTNMSRKAKSDIYRAGGADALLDGEDMVFLNPSMTRRTDAKFDPMRLGENNWLAGAAPVAAGGILGALGATGSGQAEASPRMMRNISEAIQANPNKGMIEPNSILEAVMGFLAPQAMGDATMDAYNRNRIR